MGSPRRTFCVSKTLTETASTLPANSADSSASAISSESPKRKSMSLADLMKENEINEMEAVSSEQPKT